LLNNRSFAADSVAFAGSKMELWTRAFWAGGSCNAGVGHICTSTSNGHRHKGVIELEIGNCNLNILLSHKLVMPYQRSIRLQSSIWNFASTLWNQVTHFLNPVPGFQK